MLTISRYFLIALILLQSTGCAVKPPYSFAPDEKKAFLKGWGGTVALCKNSTLYGVELPSDFKPAPIPADGRVTLGSFMNFAGGNVSYSCYPFVSFAPKEGETYFVHSFVRENKCYIELVREDRTKETGVAFEPSVGPRDCVEAKR